MEQTTIQANIKAPTKRARVTTAEKFYAFAAVLSLLLQFCTVIYDILLRSALSSIITAIDILIWALAWFRFTDKKKKMRKQIQLILPVVILFFILAIKLVIAQNFSDDYFAPSRSLYQIYSLIYALLWGMTIQLLPTPLKKRILYYFYIMLTVTVIPSYFYVFQNTDALRDGGFYGQVDFQYIYAMIPLVGLTIIALLRGNPGRKMRTVMISMVITNTGIILISNFATAMILICLSVFLGLFFTRKMRFQIVVAVFAVLIVFGLLFRGMIADIVLSISDSNFFGAVLKRRLSDIAKLLQGDGVGWSFKARIILMEGSWHSFLRYPIFGVPFNYTGRDTLGFHETWSTLLGYGGLVGFIFVIMSLIKYFRYQSKAIKNTYFINAYFTMLLVVFILSFLNPIITKSNLMITVGIMPILSCFFTQSKEKRYSEE